MFSAYSAITDLISHPWKGTPRKQLTSFPGIYSGPGARFSKAPETLRARKAISSSSVPKNGEVYAPETSCMKETETSLRL